MQEALKSPSSSGRDIPDAEGEGEEALVFHFSTGPLLVFTDAEQSKAGRASERTSSPFPPSAAQATLSGQARVTPPPLSLPFLPWGYILVVQLPLWLRIDDKAS